MAILLPLAFLILAIVAIIGLFSILAGSFIGLVLYLVVAAIIGALADAIVPGSVKYGILGSILAGIVGGWLGRLILGELGPSIFGIHIIPALVGAIIVTLIYSLLSRRVGTND
jgi:uncharacterized membrane protein YeaQ/YmgE (transglycosylase-associated protein family)